MKKFKLFVCIFSLLLVSCVAFASSLKASTLQTGNNDSSNILQKMGLNNHPEFMNLIEVENLSDLSYSNHGNSFSLTLIDGYRYYLVFENATVNSVEYHSVFQDFTSSADGHDMNVTIYYGGDSFQSTGNSMYIDKVSQDVTLNVAYSVFSTFNSDTNYYGDWSSFISVYRVSNNTSAFFNSYPGFSVYLSNIDYYDWDDSLFVSESSSIEDKCKMYGFLFGKWQKENGYSYQSLFSGNAASRTDIYEDSHRFLDGVLIGASSTLFNDNFESGYENGYSWTQPIYSVGSVAFQVINDSNNYYSSLQMTNANNTFPARYNLVFNSVVIGSVSYNLVPNASGYNVQGFNPGGGINNYSISSVNYSTINGNNSLVVNQTISTSVYEAPELVYFFSNYDNFYSYFETFSYVDMWGNEFIHDETTSAYDRALWAGYVFGRYCYENNLAWIKINENDQSLFLDRHSVGCTCCGTIETFNPTFIIGYEKGYYWRPPFNHVIDDIYLQIIDNEVYLNLGFLVNSIYDIVINDNLYHCDLSTDGHYYHKINDLVFDSEKTMTYVLTSVKYTIDSTDNLTNVTGTSYFDVDLTELFPERSFVFTYYGSKSIVTASSSLWLKHDTQYFFIDVTYGLFNLSIEGVPVDNLKSILCWYSIDGQDFTYWLDAKEYRTIFDIVYNGGAFVLAAKNDVRYPDLTDIKKAAFTDMSDYPSIQAKYKNGEITYDYCITWLYNMSPEEVNLVEFNYEVDEGTLLRGSFNSEGLHMEYDDAGNILGVYDGEGNLRQDIVYDQYGRMKDIEGNYVQSDLIKTFESADPSLQIDELAEDIGEKTSGIVGNILDNGLLNGNKLLKVVLVVASIIALGLGIWLLFKVVLIISGVADSTSKAFKNKNNKRK